MSGASSRHKEVSHDGTSSRHQEGWPRLAGLAFPELMIATAVKTRVLSGFDDPSFGAWPAPSVFQTKEYLQTWWDVFGRGRLLLIVAERNGSPVALAPLYTDQDMIYFVGSG